ncbi:hypothetical protein L596_030048 [Steinernema carpocapsae]|uniref:Uncharacterized protein n=1 Tax=Steinernema carpocapsae TaxID=34508 RepID=A0A4U5LRK4_STECR|nr:hypothetical protein L596_030048 [Steinernema carpocapsae]
MLVNCSNLLKKTPDGSSTTTRSLGGVLHHFALFRIMFSTKLCAFTNYNDSIKRTVREKEREKDQIKRASHQEAV